MSLFGFLYTAAFSITGFAFLLIYLSRKQIKCLPYFFLIYLAYECLSFVFELFLNAPIFTRNHFWFAMVMWSSYLVAPCLWLFACEISEDRTPSFKELPRWHYLVLSLGFLFVMPTLNIVSLSESEPGKPVLLGVNWWQIKDATSFACVALGLSYIAYIGQQCYQRLQQHAIKFERDSFILFHEMDSYEYNILRLSLIAVSITWLVNILRSVHCMTVGISNNYTLLLTCLDIIATVTVFFLILKKLLFHNPVVSSTKVQEHDSKKEEHSEKYSHSVLDDSLSSSIAIKLKRILDESKIYTDNSLTLRALSEAVGEKHHYVSQVINQELNTSFFELINGYRIRHAQDELLRDSKKTVIMIAEEAGFNSKSTFNTAFKKITGMTPSQFRAQKS